MADAGLLITSQRRSWLITLFIGTQQLIYAVWYLYTNLTLAISCRYTLNPASWQRSSQVPTEKKSPDVPPTTKPTMVASAALGKPLRKLHRRRHQANLTFPHRTTHRRRTRRKTCPRLTSGHGLFFRCSQLQQRRIAAAIDDACIDAKARLASHRRLRKRLNGHRRPKRQNSPHASQVAQWLCRVQAAPYSL